MNFLEEWTGKVWVGDCLESEEKRTMLFDVAGLADN